MEDLLVDFSQSRLSDRARAFLESDRAGSGLAFDRPTVPKNYSSDVGSPANIDSMAKLVREYDDTYGGLSFWVPGGVLVGELRLGADRGRIWRADDGRFVFNAAEHSDAQCAFVISENGEFGSSWSGEFNKLFDSIEHLIECASMWAAVGNWCYVSIVSHDPGLVLRAVAGVEIDEPSAGSSSFWWLNNELAVVTGKILTRA